MERRATSLISVLITLNCFTAYGQVLEGDDRIYGDCGRTITVSSGVLVSANFSSESGYPANHVCSWKLVVDEGSTIKLVFGYFNLERGTNCQNDRVSVYNGPSADYPLLGRFCGSFRPGAQVSTSNKMYVTFVTDASNQKRGFYAIFSAERQEIATEGSCGGLMNSPTGSFQSPNYQISTYPPSVSCSWHIHVPGSRNIRLLFKDFDVEKSVGCKYDAVILNKGTTSSSESRGVDRYCGQLDSLPEEIVSLGEELFVTFISDASGFGRGFVAHYETDFTSENVADSRTPPDFRENSRTNPEIPQSLTTRAGRQSISESTVAENPSKPTKQPLRDVTECPKRCTKVRPKARICNANYAAAVRISDPEDILEGTRQSVEVISSYKDLTSSTRIQLQLQCPSCFKIKRAGVYLVIGNLENGVLAQHDGDYVSKYKSKKHSKVIPKWIKKCENRRRRRKRRGHNKRSS